MISKYQVRVDDEKVASELEDPGLLKHMSDARAELAAHDGRHAKIPTPAELRAQDLNIRRQFAQFITETDAEKLALQTVSDEVRRFARAAENLRQPRSGRAPVSSLHSYPPLLTNLPPDVVAYVELLQRRIDAQHVEIERIGQAFDACAKQMIVTRREYELFATNCGRAIAALTAADAESASGKYLPYDAR
jgi:hypothetical protein